MAAHSRAAVFFFAMHDDLSILTLLPQFPFDPSGGAVRCMDTISRFLASSDTRVTTLGTFATERAKSSTASSPKDILRAMNLSHQSAGGFLRFRHSEIDYILLDTGDHDPISWQKDAALRAAFDRELTKILDSFRPRVVHTFGAGPPELARQKICRDHGAAVALSVRNNAYFDPTYFEHADSVLTPSQFLSDQLRSRIGVESVALPVPMNFTDIFSPAREPVFTTFINPSIDKGVFFFARLAEELSRERPDIPIMVVESRGTAGTLAAAAKAGNFDLARHQNIMISPGVPNPRDIYAVSRVLLAPSIVEETAGRVLVEAIINGVVPIASGKGGMTETMRGAGFILPLPASATMDSRTPPSAAEVTDWKDLVIRLCDDEPFYQQHSAKAKQTADFYREENLAPMYADYFRTIQTRVC